MNYSTKYTFPLFESVCVKDGLIQHANYHENRFNVAFQRYFKKEASYTLFDGIEIPSTFTNGIVKLRISYGEHTKDWKFSNYSKKPIKTLQLVEHKNIEYDLKFEDRSQLQSLYQKRNLCDDILLLKNGFVTDTSYCNIIFYDGKVWYTPHSYLLNGTCRQRLIDAGIVKTANITSKNLHSYKGFQIINAMLDFCETEINPISNIKL